MLFLCNTTIKAHGDLDQRILELTILIDAHPDSASLYYHRGKLRFQHEEYQAAIDDINISIAKGYEDESRDIYLAKSLYKLDKYQDALTKLNLFLKDDPNNVVALNLKGRIFYAQNKFVESALAFEDVIELSIRSLPENYLEAARSWTKSSHPEKYDKAINILELGLKKLGPIITIQNALIELHLSNEYGEKAIATQLAIIEKTNRKESAYFKLAEIYSLLKETENAKSAAESALYHLNKLPNRIRSNSAMKALKNDINQLITNL